MSEYSEPHSVARLIGAPPGYVGHDEGGQLTEAVRRRPYTVILFDEVEKAHPRVLTVMLQILDEGRLTDSKGRTVDFTNTVIILTSNIGAEALLGLVDSSNNNDKDMIHNKVMTQIRARFAPEFLNRLSAIVMFQSLGLEQLEKIVFKAMKGVKRRLEANHGIRVVLESSGGKAILLNSVDNQYGARPIERYVESSVVTTLSRMLIGGEIVSGSVVHIEAAAESDDEGSSVDDCDVSLLSSRKRHKVLQYRVENGDSNMATDIESDSIDENWETMEE